MPDHALKYMYMLNYGVLNYKSLHYSSIQVLIDFINSVIAIHVIFIRNFIFYFSLGLLHEFSVWKLSSSCLLNWLSVSVCLMISATWWINFPMVLPFYIESEFWLSVTCSSTNSVACWNVCFGLICLSLTLFRMGLRSCSPMGRAKNHPPKIFHTYPTNMNLGIVIPYLKNIQKPYKS